MGSYRRLISAAFRCYNRKNEQSVSQNYFRSRSDPRSSGTCERSILQSVTNNNQLKCHNLVAKRFYHAALKPKGLGYRRIRRNLIILTFVGCAVVVPVYYLNLKTVPYAKRGHFAVVPTSVEKSMGDLLFKSLKSEEWEGKILGPDHPESIRVEKIGQDIIGAIALTTAHLKELELEIVVVDEPDTVDSEYLPGGKIVVFTGLLNRLETDAEIAAIIAHEVGHALARHSAEAMSGFMWMLMLLSFVTYHYKELISRLPHYLATGFIYTVFLALIFKFYFSRQESEADRIGMFISASAGYDPRIAIKMYKKFVEEERVELLCQPEVIDEALAIYRNALKDKDKDKDKDKIVGDC